MEFQHLVFFVVLESVEHGLMAHKKFTYCLRNLTLDTNRNEFLDEVFHHREMVFVRLRYFFDNFKFQFKILNLFFILKFFQLIIF